MRKVKATFTGQHLSCGYEKGTEYEINVIHEKGDNIHIEKSNGANTGSSGVGLCEYESVISFLNNWSKITVIQ